MWLYHFYQICLYIMIYSKKKKIDCYVYITHEVHFICVRVSFPLLK